MANNFCGKCGSPLDSATGSCPKCDAKQNHQNGIDDPTMQADNFRYDDSRNRNEKNSDDEAGINSARSFPGGAQTASGTEQKGGKSGLPAWLLITTTVVVLAVVFVVLLLTGVIRIGNEKDNHTTASVDQGVPMILDGILTSETYNGNDIYVLNLGEARVFSSPSYGSLKRTDKVQIVSELASDYVNHTVRVDGIQRYRSESAHRYEVIMVDVEIEDLGPAAAEATNILTTTAPVSTQAPVTVTVTATAAVTTPPQTQAPQPTFNGDGLPLPIDTDGYQYLPAEMDASTSHPNNGERSYTPNKAADDDPETCWMAYNPKKNGAGVWIRLDLGEKKKVAGLHLLNGNCWEDVDDVYHLNGRVREFTVYGDDDRPIRSGTAEDVKGKYQGFTFPEVAYTRYIKFYVDSTYKGSKNDTVVCISELRAISAE